MTSALHQLARRIGLGRALRAMYYTPVGLARKSIREGGPLEQRRTEQGRLQMIEAAKTLPPLKAPAGDRSCEVHFLTGARFWYQTLFCAYSLQLHSDVRVTPVCHDDGTLSPVEVALLQRAIPWAQIVPYADIEERLDRYLPASRYPSLRSRRVEYPHLRKLTDIHIRRTDGLWCSTPTCSFSGGPASYSTGSAAPDRPCHMVDASQRTGIAGPYGAACWSAGSPPH